LWVITSGLKAGDRILVEGLQKVRPGVKVNAQVVQIEEEDKEKKDGKSEMDGKGEKGAKEAKGEKESKSGDKAGDAKGKPGEAPAKAHAAEGKKTE
jgi:hypothetical protein